MKLFRWSCVMVGWPQSSKATMGVCRRCDVVFLGAGSADLGEEGCERIGAMMDMRGKLAPSGDGAMFRMVCMSAGDQHRGHAERVSCAEIVRQIVEHGGRCAGDAACAEETLIGRALRLGHELRG